MQPSVMPKGADHHDLRSGDFSRIAQDLQIRKVQVEAVVALLEKTMSVDAAIGSLLTRPLKAEE